MQAPQDEIETFRFFLFFRKSASIRQARSTMKIFAGSLLLNAEGMQRRTPHARRFLE